MNPVYGPVQPATPYGNHKNLTYTGYPTGYPTATAPTYTPGLYQTGSPGYPPVLLMKQGWAQPSMDMAGAQEASYDPAMDAGSEGRQYQASAATLRYATGTPYKVPPTQTSGAPPPYSPSTTPYPAAMYPIRSVYPQQNLYTQGAYYTQPVYAAQPHVIHHTTVVQPNSIPSALYPAPVPAAGARPSAVALGMVTGTTMAMSAGTLLTAPQHSQHLGGPAGGVPTYRHQASPGYSYMPSHW